MKFYSNGKILITGEYFVLNGALSLALPTVYGQYLEINDNDSKIINWTSYNKNKEIWFKCELDKDSLKVKYSSSKEVSEIIKELISFIREKESNFLNRMFEDEVFWDYSNFSSDISKKDRINLIKNFLDL